MRALYNWIFLFLWTRYNYCSSAFVSSKMTNFVTIAFFIISIYLVSSWLIFCSFANFYWLFCNSILSESRVSALFFSRHFYIFGWLNYRNTFSLFLSTLYRRPFHPEATFLTAGPPKYLHVFSSSNHPKSFESFEFTIKARPFKLATTWLPICVPFCRKCPVYPSNLNGFPVEKSLIQSASFDAEIEKAFLSLNVYHSLT